MFPGTDRHQYTFTSYVIRYTLLIDSDTPIYIWYIRHIHTHIPTQKGVGAEKLSVQQHQYCDIGNEVWLKTFQHP